MEEQGLAQTASRMPSITDIIKMIMQGAQPEELVEQGIPEKLVMVAIQELQKQIQQPQDDEAGLANSIVRSNDQIQPIPSR